MKASEIQEIADAIVGVLKPQLENVGAFLTKLETTMTQRGQGQKEGPGEQK